MKDACVSNKICNANKGWKQSWKLHSLHVVVMSLRLRYETVLGIAVTLDASSYCISADRLTFPSGHCSLGSGGKKRQHPRRGY